MPTPYQQAQATSRFIDLWMDDDGPISNYPGESVTVAQVQRALIHGADINAQGIGGKTVLMCAAYLGKLDCLKSLIESGADVNAVDHTGNTALQYAALRNHAECIEALIASGADVNLEDIQRDTPLMTVARCGYVDCIKLLVAGGADVNAKNETGTTALILAVQQSRVECVQYLIEHGADVNAGDKAYNTALSYAEQNQHSAILDALLAAGATDEPCWNPAPPPLITWDGPDVFHGIEQFYAENPEFEPYYHRKRERPSRRASAPTAAFPLDDENWMRRCLELAEEARRHGDAPVGAVIVKDARIVAKASEQVVLTNDVTAHAELVAIKEACRMLQTRDLSQCVLYTNAEPCWMCSYAIREARIARVVIGLAVEGIGGATSRYPLLTDADIPGWNPPPSLTWGVLADESTFLQTGPSA